MRAIDQALHARIHEQMLAESPDAIFGPRLRVLDEFEGRLGVKIGGSVLDLGCGNGYASIWMAKTRDVSEVIALDGSEAAVRELLPRNIAHHGVGHLVRPVQGEFESLPFRNRFDFVVSFGALHHGECLFSTLASVSRALRDGGYLIAQEPAMPNTTTNQQYVDKYNVIEKRFGLELRNGDRVDRFFRNAEYVTAAAFNSLDLLYVGPFRRPVHLAGWLLSAATAPVSGLVRWLKQRAAQAMGDHAGDDSEVPDHRATLERNVMIFRKCEMAEVPHLWRGLSPAVTVDDGA